MRILLFGGNGYIGSEFVNQFEYFNDVKLIRLPSRNFDGGGYSFKELDFIIRKTNPYAIINCSAYVGNSSIVDCETRKDETIRSNIIFPKMLGEICKECGIVLGHMSSACFYNGYPSTGYKETDERILTFKTSCSFYTGTKAMAEDYLDEVNKKYIWRIRLPFDQRDVPHKNYLSKLMRFDKVLNVQNSLSNRKELVNACINCIIRCVPFGTYHVTNPGKISNEEIIKMMKNILKIDKEFKYYENIESFDKLRGVPTDNTFINNEKLERTGIKMTPIHESVEWSLKNWVNA